MITMSRLEFIMCIMISGYVFCDAKLIHSEDLLENLGTLLPSNEQYSAQIDQNSWFWKEYEFTSEVENREELRITDTYVWRDQNLNENITNWQYVNHNYEVYIAGTQNSTLFLYQFDHENRFLSLRAELSIAEVIQSFKIISLPSENLESTKVEDSIVVILSIEDENETQYLKWYYLQNQKFHGFWIWELLRTVRDMKHFKINGEYKLLVLYETDVYFNRRYSLVEVYDIKTRGQFSKELSCQFLVNELSDIEICPSREGSRMFALMDQDHVMLHEYKEILTKCVLKPVKNITVSNANSMLCFESCSRKHFAVRAGSVINFFTFQLDEFVYEKDMETLLNGIGDVHFVTIISVDTYRNDVVLLIQLKNSTVLSLSWQNAKFQFVRLPNNKLDEFDLSKVTIIPEYGFVTGNIFVEFRVDLVPLPNSNEEDVESLFRTKSMLENILNYQESKIVEIELDNQYISPNHLEIENISNLTNIDVDDLIINKIDTSKIFIGSSNVTLQQLQTNYEESSKRLHQLSAKIIKIENEVDEMAPISLDDLNFADEIEVMGNLEISGTATVESLSVHSLNGFEMHTLINSCLNSDAKITGNKTFPSIEFSEGNFKIKNLNGAPIETYQFHDDTTPNYPDIDFTGINKLVIKGNLNVSTINNVDWDGLMAQLVFKNKKKFIPGSTKISGVLTTKFTQTKYLNDLRYPLDYVLKSGPGIVDVTGIKTFETLTVSDLKGVKTINNFDIDEFITLTADQNLEHEIIFENLVIEESLQIDGTIEGLPEQSGNPDLTLLNSNVIQSPATINKLYVSGKVYVQNSIDGMEWSELDDLILKTDKNVKVTGMKTFSDNVHIKGNLEIRSGIINGHSIEDFITVDTRQIMPNLSEITGNVSFTHVTYEDLDNLENELREDVDESGVAKCSTKSFVFSKKLIIDEFSISMMNGNDTEPELSSKFDHSFNNTSFENLKCKKLIVSNIESQMVNGINLKELESKRITRSTYQEISGTVKINSLETHALHTNLINNRSHEQLENLTRKINSYYKELLDNQRPIESLTTDKYIVTSEVNGKNLQELWNTNRTSGFILRANGSVENLIVEGLVNGVNFTEKYFDCVLKTDKNIIIKGPKKINKFTADHLEVQYINSHAVEDIITDTKNQTLIGPLIIKGSAYVSETFSSDGKINEVDFKNIDIDIQKLEDSVYKFTGDFIIDNNYTSINNMIVAQKIQGQDINLFMESLIYLNDTNIDIPCTKILSGPVQFNDYITVIRNLAGVDLEKFYENAIRIDEPTFVNSPVIFADDVFLHKDLTVVDSLKVATIEGINIDNLIENAVYVNRPTSILETITLSNVTFKSDVTVKYWNDTNLDMLLTLKENQVIQDTLIGVNISAENLTILGLLNSENLTQIYENTFMISADQHIRGNISFLNNTYVHGDFVSRYVNDIDMTKIISLDASDPMAGDFIFDSPVVFHDDITVMQYLNNINISQWQSNIVMPSSPTERIISGNWTIHGNVDFKGNVSGSGYINDISIESLSSTIKIQNEKIKQSLSSEMKNIQTICKNLQEQRNRTLHLLHQFKSFEYFRVLQFDKKIESMHHFEFNDTDYILVNFETCQVDIYAYTNNGFSLFANTSEFGNVKEYLDFNHENNLYLVTVGKLKCGRDSASLWMLMNDQIVHIYDFGNVTSVEKLNTLTFVLVMDHQVQEWSILNIHRKMFEPLNTKMIASNKIRFLKNGNDTLLASCDIIYRFQSGISKFEEMKNPFKSIDISSFRAGIYQKEYVLLHDDEISNDHFFIYNQDLFQPKELQSISARKPNSFNMINFDGLYESLLIFSENKKEIQIYEYKGIENFKFHSRIPMKVEKLYTFQLKTHPYFVKRRCISVIHDSKITILEAKMYGEKLNPDNQFICSVT